MIQSRTGNVLRCYYVDRASQRSTPKQHDFNLLLMRWSTESNVVVGLHERIETLLFWYFGLHDLLPFSRSEINKLSTRIQEFKRRYAAGFLNPDWN